MNVYELLKKLGILYDEIEHKAINTVEEALKEDVPSKINGQECKNLFLKDDKKRYYLVFMDCYKRSDLKKLAKIIGVSKLSFASEEALKEILDLQAGGVTPLGIINDKDNMVEVLIDSDLKNKKVLMHPNVNTKTISINEKDLIKIIEYLNHKYLYISDFYFKE